MKELTVEQKAAMWDALMSCQRIRMFGHSNLGDPSCQHLGLELWSKFPKSGRDCQCGRKELLTFVEAMLSKNEKGTSK